ncbi:MAG TPA: serine hydrolase domain-containing protein [Longimicrobiaceae bacterium]|nr:serine hydrolase domain-containing protein [Longimicrobiaceae bacterium]
MRFTGLILTALLALHGPPAHAQPAAVSCAGIRPPGDYAPALAQARTLALQLKEAFDFPALSIAVAVDGRVVWSEAFGYADVERRAPACPGTLFRIGSVSKTLTAAAAMRLREAGTIDLDLPVQSYVAEFPRHAAPITLRLLGTHLSGIRHYRGEEDVGNVRYARLADGLGIFSHDPLEHDPGARFTYSSYGYNLLGVALERATGKDFELLLRETVLTPLGMRATTLDRSDAPPANRARFYEQTEDGRIEPAREVDNSYKWPSGGLLSTPEDLARFGSALLEPGYLRDESLALLFTSAVTSAGSPTGYGFGWQVEPTASRGRQAGHIGALLGGVAGLFIDFDRRVVVAFAANLKGGPPKPGTQPAPPPAFVELFANARDRARRP